jgi:hypothetical protein
MTRQLITIAALVAAMALPGGALAMTGGAGDGTAAPRRAQVQPPNFLQDGKYLVGHTTVPAVNVVRVVNPSGFDIGDASVGAALAVTALAVVAGVVVLRRDRKSTVTPQHSKAR